MLSIGLQSGVILVSLPQLLFSLLHMLINGISSAIRFTWMARIGGVSAGLIIARRLCMITTGTTVQGSRRDRVRSVAIDLAIGLGIPIAQLIICTYDDDGSDGR